MPGDSPPPTNQLNSPTNEKVLPGEPRIVESFPLISVLFPLIGVRFPLTSMVLKRESRLPACEFRALARALVTACIGIYRISRKHVCS